MKLNSELNKECTASFNKVLSSAKSRIYRHEDFGLGTNVFYDVSLTALDTNKPSVVFGVEKMPMQIYHNSNRTKVIVPPDYLTVNFDFEETRKLMSLFVEATSLYMASIREKLYKKNTLKYFFSPKIGKYNISFQAVNKKISNAGKERNSPRLLMIFFSKETGEEVLSIKLKKTKIIILMQIIKSLYEEHIHKCTFTYKDTLKRRLPLIRIGDIVSVGDIWIHGREIQKFQDYIERVIFDFKYRVGDGKELFSYRQISASFPDEEEVAQVKLIKHTKEHGVFLDKNENIVEHSFVINSEAAALFFLLLPKSIGFNLEDIEVFNINYEEEKERKRRISEENEDKAFDPYLVEIKEKEDRQNISSMEDGDFILNTIENQLVLKVDKNKKFDTKNREGKLSMAIRYRDFIVSDDSYKVGRTNHITENYEEVNKLVKCVIDLKIDWLYIFALCAEAVHSSADMQKNEYGHHSHVWRFKNSSFLGTDYYGLKVVADSNNKASVVFLIDHHIGENGEYDNEMLPSNGGSRMRIPLFKEHVRTLLKGIIGLSPQYDNYYWMNKFPVYSDDFDEITGYMSLGLRRFFHKDLNKEVVSFGIVGKSTQQVYLTDNDRDTLFFSAYYRLMYGRWLQFSGEQISISFDGWLTDRHNEYKIEFDMEASIGARGALPALAMLFATARGKKYMNNKGDS